MRRPPNVEQAEQALGTEPDAERVGTTGSVHAAAGAFERREDAAEPRRRVGHFLVGRGFWLLWFGLAAASVALTVAARTTTRLPGDLELERAVQRIDLPAIRTVLDVVNAIGGPIGATAMIVGVGLLLLALRHVHLAFTFVYTNGLRAVDSLVKFLVNRPRPDPHLVHVSSHSSESSFPSGHVFSAVLLYGVLIVLIELLPVPHRLRRCLQAPCLLVIVLMGPARVAVGAHWPSDVLGGYLWGAALLLLVLHATHMLGLLRSGHRGAAEVVETLSALPRQFSSPHP